MKIAYCTDSICYAGGIQRVTIAKANKLALKNEVWIIAVSYTHLTLPTNSRV